MKLIDSVYEAKDKMNVKLAGNGDEIKIIEEDDIKSVVELYRTVYKELSQAGCQKFIHPMNENDVEKIVESDSSAIVGYFKEGKLAGALYTKPFAKNSPYFQTPVFEGDKKTYAIGGVVVDPKTRGNGVVSKITNVAVEGVKNYAEKNKQSNIAGAGFEISCENFGSLMSLGCAKEENGNNIFNLHGIHYIDNPETKDKDLTILGYTSFEKDATTGLYLPERNLDGNQKESLEKLNSVITVLGVESAGANTKTVDDHNLYTLNDYVSAPIKDIISFDKDFSANYPPQLNQ